MMTRFPSTTPANFVQIVVHMKFYLK